MEVHILNGDALLTRFPKGIEGERIVIRECLVDGPVSSEAYLTFIQRRIEFLSKEYGASEQQYQERVAPAFEKIMRLPEGASVHLWFEDDLFCQVHLWFVCHLLRKRCATSSISLVRPPDGQLQYGFGGLDEAGLHRAFGLKKVLDKDVYMFSEMWECYLKGDLAGLKTRSDRFPGRYPFLQAAVQAHIDRQPDSHGQGKPIQLLAQIKSELKTDDFGSIFKAFSKRAPIYGFGDLQVKRLLKKL